MLKFQIEKIEDVEESLRAMYEEKGGKFQLKVDGIPAPPTPDKDIADRLRKLEANNQELLKEKQRAKEEAEKAALEAAKKSGDIESLEKSWNEKLKTRESELLQQLNERESIISNLSVGQTATALAAELFGEHAELMQHHITSRLTYELADGKPKVRVLDDGKPSAKTLDELKAEIRNNAKFAPFVVASKASGGNLPGKPAGGGTNKKWTELNDTERVTLRRENPAEYQRLVDEYKRSS
jgi:hypothetical protein